MCVCVCTLDPEALLVLDDEVLLAVLEFPQVILRFLCHGPQLLKHLVDLLVFLRCSVRSPAPCRAHLTIKIYTTSC